MPSEGEYKCYIPRKPKIYKGFYGEMAKMRIEAACRRRGYQAVFR